MNTDMSPDEILNNLPPHPFMELCGIELLKDENGTFYVQTEVTEKLHNPYGIVHGGLFFTMADIITGVTARLCGKPAVTLDSNFHFLSNVSSGTLTARAEVVRTGNTVAVIRADIKDNSGTLLAEGTFTYYFLK